MGGGVEFQISADGLILGTHGTPSSLLNGMIWNDGTDVYVRTGSSTKSMSDIGSGGGSGANVSLSNLNATGEAHFASTALNNLGTTSINQSLIPSTDNLKDLGTDIKEWRNLYIDGTAFIDVADIRDLDISASGYIDMHGSDISDVGEIVIEDQLASRGDSGLGTTTSDTINFYGRTNYSNGYTDGSTTPSATASGYITVRIGGTTLRKIYYY